jgi:hypothetical protein
MEFVVNGSISIRLLSFKLGAPQLIMGGQRMTDFFLREQTILMNGSGKAHISRLP